MQDDGADLWAGNGRCMVGGASIVGVNTLLARRWCGGKISNGATGCMCIQEVHCWRKHVAGCECAGRRCGLF